jgi:SsrA-binding protein
MAREKKVVYTNRKAHYSYAIGKKYIAGIVLQGGEIKSIRQGEVSVKEAYCYVDKDGSFIIKNMYVKPHVKRNQTTEPPAPTRDRNLMLNKEELHKVQKAMEQQGNTIVPLSVFISARGLAKIEIGIATGKKKVDKRNSIKERDMSRDQARAEASE